MPADRAKFFDEQNAFTDDLNYVEATRIAEINGRFYEISGAFGVIDDTVSGERLVLSNPDPYTLEVGAGVAYDDLGRAIRVVTGDSYSRRTAPRSLSFGASDAGKLVTLKYNEEDTTDQQNPVTGANAKTRVQSYPTLAIRTAAEAHEIILGTIATVDGSGNCSFDLTTRQFWGARLTPQQLADLQEALDEAIGHQRIDHVAGIEIIGDGGDPGAVTVDGSTTPDKAVVTQTVDGDSVLINGTRLSGAGKFSETDVTFIDDAVTDEPQLWALHINDEGVVGKTLAAQYTDAQVIVGMQLVDLCPYGIPWPSGTLVIQHWGTVTHNFRIAGSFDVVQLTTSGLYTLRANDNPDQAVLIYVTVGSLPSGGSSGSPHEDTITVYPDIYDLTPGHSQDFGHYHPPVTVKDADDNPGCWFIAYLWWYGTALNLIGYGTWATTGIARPKRNKGTLGSSQLATAFRTRLLDMTRETRADGFVAPPVLAGPLGTGTPSDASLIVAVIRGDRNEDVADIEKSVYAYMGGRRVQVPAVASLTLADDTDNVIYLEDNGDGTSTWGSQVGTGEIGTPLSSTRMPVWNVTTADGGVTSYQDISVCLPRIDREAARLNRDNVGDFSTSGDINAGGAVRSAGVVSTGQVTVSGASLSIDDDALEINAKDFGLLSLARVSALVRIADSLSGDCDLVKSRHVDAVSIVGGTSLKIEFPTATFMADTDYLVICTIGPASGFDVDGFFPHAEPTTKDRGYVQITFRKYDSTTLDLSPVFAADFHVNVLVIGE